MKISQSRHLGQSVGFAMALAVMSIGIIVLINFQIPSL